MEFRLPTELANKLVAYDQTLKKQIKSKKEEENVSTRLKRKTKLSFPCPDIFFDLTIEQIYEIYEDLCYSPVCDRYYKVYSNVNPMNMRYLIAWNKCYETKDESWYCWKIGDKDCPIILRYWDESFLEDQYTEFRADSSLTDLRVAQENPFNTAYKTERPRSHAFCSLISAINTQVEMLYPAESSGLSTQLKLYAAKKYFYEFYFEAKDENSFYPAKWLSEQQLYAISEPRLNLKTNSTIVNSKYYQNQLKKEVEAMRLNVGMKRIDSQPFIHKLNYIYLFLTVFPNEYDRSIHLYEQFSQYNFYSNWSTWGVFSRLEYLGANLSAKFMEWFRSKVTPQMFAKWILEEVDVKQKRSYDTTIRDTMEMLIKVWQRLSYVTNPNPEYLKEPKRWRLQDAHDHYVGITLQMDNQMKKLPTDLISSPVTFETEVGSIRMFQPATNHEVIRWGKAVRNCVGSAGYDERVLQRKAFLVFAERNGKPWLTSLLTLNAGILQVGQTVSPFNASLAPGEQEVYEKCLQQAIGIG